MMSEPLSLLVLMAGMSLAILAPAFHYHQFGEPTRMARDAGVSAVLVAASAFAVFGIIRSFRREMETGTASVAVAVSVSRVGFFLSKTVGGYLAFAAFLAALSCTSLTVVNAARIGGEVGERTGGLARLWGPSLASALAVVVLPVILAAILNRFGRFRFCLTAFCLTLLLGVVSAVYRFDASLAGRYLPVLLVAASVPAVLLSVAASAGALLRANATGVAVGVAAVLLVPFAGNHCLSDSLSVGGCVDPCVFCVALVSAALAVLSSVSFGAAFVKERDLS